MAVEWEHQRQCTTLILHILHGVPWLAKMPRFGSLPLSSLMNYGTLHWINAAKSARA
jgi:hypothetical protein